VGLAKRLGVELQITRTPTEAELVALYCRALAVVFVPIMEPFGLVALEAMACGTPVIATAVGGVPEIVTSTDAGAVVKERSAPALARAVRELFARPRERAATRRFAEQFGWDATSKGQLQLFRQVLAANTPPRAMQMARAG
jgi:glycosyltransferase involved in cell wall biosynthesis